VDIDRLLEVTRISRPEPDQVVSVTSPDARVGVARDEAFCFYYEDNLDLLRQAGAELVEFSPIDGPFPEGLDGLYIGGGYPELHAARLAANEPVKQTIRDFAANGGPIYAECGGLMYLGQTLELEDEAHALCGILPFSTRMPAPLKIAYVEIDTTGGLFGPGRAARGHLFHHSEVIDEPAVERCFRLTTPRGDERAEGYQVANVLGSYVHVHFGSAPDLATAFVDRCRMFKLKAV
ncbi:MAG TPA: hypothetical protein VK605_02960, partial [Solirubrobacteraceae bacterium]|nr:hypothetical protein [Solirubrobacteraceae bacterium]